MFVVRNFSKLLTEKIDHNIINVCGECESEYYRNTSKMEDLCPECSHVLYGYDNCDHVFRNGRCIKCFWNGSMSDYIKKIKLKENETEDSLSCSMQNEVIKIASNRLGRPLSDYLIAKVCQKKWSYKGLEMIIDSVKTLDTREIENYLSKLE